MIILRMVTAATVAIFVASPASARPDRPDCTIDVQELGEAKINRYNALEGGDYLESIRLRLRNKGDEACTGLIRISRISGTPELVGPQGGKLTYTIVDQADFGRVIYDPRTNNGNAVIVSVPANSTTEISPRLFVAGSQAGRSGRYAATLEATFIPAGEIVGIASARFNVSAQVMASVQANFVGSTNPQNARLELGELVPNKNGSIGLQIRSSSEYQISFRSENKGVLAGPGSAEIPYTMSYAGQLIDLTTRDRKEFSPPDPVRPSTNLIDVTIGQFSGARAGNYSDEVTITISAL